MPYLLLTLSALIWSGNFVLSRGMHSDIPPFALSFWRWTTALAILLIIGLPHLLREKELIWQNRRFIISQGLLGVTGFNTLIYLAVQHTTAINAVLVNSTIPVIIAVISWFMYKERLSGRQMSGVLISFSGVVYIVCQGSLQTLFDLKFNQGDLLVFLAAICWAFYSANLKRFPKGLHPLSFLTGIVIVGVIALLPCYLFEIASGKEMTLSFSSLLTIGYVAIFASIIAFIFWNRGVAELGANIAGPFIHLMPLFSTILAVLFLGEKFTSVHLVAVALIFFGILLTTVKPPVTENR